MKRNGRQWTGVDWKVSEVKGRERTGTEWISEATARAVLAVVAKTRGPDEAKDRKG